MSKFIENNLSIMRKHGCFAYSNNKHEKIIEWFEFNSIYSDEKRKMSLRKYSNQYF